MASRGNVQRDYIIEGVVVDRATQRGVRGLRVDTWDRDTRYHDLLGQAVTDDNGAFTVAFDSDYFGDYAPDRAPDVFYRVYRDDTEVLSTFNKPQYNMPRGTTQVRLEVDLPQFQPTGTDRITTQQAFKMVDWWQASDFRGVARQAGDKTMTVAKLFGAVASDGFKNFDFAPVQPKGTQERDVVNQDQDTARRALASQNVDVTDVRPVSDLSSGTQLKSVTQYPLQLSAGDHVTLYQQDGVVKFYTRDPVAASIADEATITRIDTDVQAIKARVQSVDDMRVEIANVKAANDDAATRAVQDAATLKATTDELQSVRSDLDQVRQESANKDLVIQKLQSDLVLVRTAQDNLASQVSAGKIHALELAVQRIGRAGPLQLRRAAKKTPAKKATRKKATAKRATAKRATPKKATRVPAKTSAKRPAKKTRKPGRR